MIAMIYSMKCDRTTGLQRLVCYWKSVTNYAKINWQEWVWSQWMKCSQLCIVWKRYYQLSTPNFLMWMLHRDSYCQTVWLLKLWHLKCSVISIGKVCNVSNWSFSERFRIIISCFKLGFVTIIDSNASFPLSPPPSPTDKIIIPPSWWSAEQYGSSFCLIKLLQIPVCLL